MHGIPPKRSDFVVHGGAAFAQGAHKSTDRLMGRVDDIPRKRLKIGKIRNEKKVAVGLVGPLGTDMHLGMQDLLNDGGQGAQALCRHTDVFGLRAAVCLRQEFEHHNVAYHSLLSLSVEQLFGLVARLARYVHPELVQGLIVDLRKQNGRVHLALAQLFQLLHRKLGRL